MCCCDCMLRCGPWPWICCCAGVCCCVSVCRKCCCECCKCCCCGCPCGTCVNVCCICCGGACIWICNTGYWFEAWLYSVVLMPILWWYLCCLLLDLSLINKFNVSCHISHWLVVPPPPLESHRSPVIGYQPCHQSISWPQCLSTRLSSSGIL